jgi:hypothetical protein
MQDQFKSDYVILKDELKNVRLSHSSGAADTSSRASAYYSPGTHTSAPGRTADASISHELQKQLVNAITKSDWPKLSGQGEYNHMDFVHWIDTARRDSHVPDEVIVLKLLTILEGVALIWYKTMCMTFHTNKWTFWRGAICQKFGTTN